MIGCESVLLSVTVDSKGNLVGAKEKTKKHTDSVNIRNVESAPETALFASAEDLLFRSCNKQPSRQSRPRLHQHWQQDDG